MRSTRLSPVVRLGFLACSIAVALLGGACGGSTTGTDVVGPTASRCGTTATASTATFSHDGGVATVSVGAPRECQWSASTTASWLSLSQSSGRGDATIRITAATNGATDGRTGRVIVDEQALVFEQKAAPRPPAAPAPPPAPAPNPTPTPSPPPQPQPPVACTFTFDPARAELDARGGEGRVIVRTEAACGWTATSGAPWIVIGSGRQGSGNGEIHYRVSGNSGSAPRHSSIAVAGHDFAIEQRGAQAPPPAPACSFELNRTAASFGAPGGDGEVHVKADSGCAWDASSAAPWITIVAGARGSGSGDVRYRVSRNTSTGERAGTLTIAGRTHSVRQDGEKPEQPEKVDVEGRVTSLAGECPHLSMDVDGVAVRTSGSTRFKGGNCSHIRVGTKVAVKGERSGSGPLQAEEVRIGR